MPGLPRDAEGSPVFAEPWQAQAFAITVGLHEAGHFAWGEWAERLGARIRERRDEPDAAGEGYWLAWLAALEDLVAENGLAGMPELAARRDAWDRAARATPHGRPVELDAAGQRED